jgi:hypothetical protein
MLSDSVIALLKFGRAEHIEKFVGKGELYMNTLAYFKNLERKEEADAHRADPHEGSDYCLPPGTKLFCQQGSEWQEIPSILTMTVAKESTQRTNIFCMYTLWQSCRFIDERILKWGDSLACITNGNEFGRRVETAARCAGVKLGRRSLVQYVDEKTYHGEMGPFRKFSTHDYQREYRIAITADTGEPYRLMVGDLSDIAFIGKTSELDARSKVSGLV